MPAFIPAIATVAALSALLTASLARSATCTSVAAGGDWNNAATWTGCAGGNGSTANTPGAADTAIIATTDPGVVNLTVAEVVGNLTINHDVATNTALSMSATLTVSTLLTLTSGVVATNGFTLTLANDCTTPSATRTAGWIDGYLRLTYPATDPAACTFVLGSNGAYVPLAITKTGTNAGTLTGTSAAGDHADTTKGISGINANKSLNRTWTLTAATLASNTPHSAAFTYSAGETDGTATASSFILRKRTSGVWTSPALGGAPTATSLTATSLTSFGIYAIGEALTVPRKAPFLHIHERY